MRELASARARCTAGTAGGGPVHRLRSVDDWPELEDSSRSSSDQIPVGTSPSSAEIYTTAAGFYVACLKNRYFDEAQEFAEWFLDAFDIDLEN